MTAGSDWLTVVAPLSLESWYGAFAGAESPVMFVGEDDCPVEALAQEVLAQAAGRGVRILSGHDSLFRDVGLGRRLHAAGLRVIGQSTLAAAAGVDKVLQKRILATASIDTPQWGLWDDFRPTTGALLSKRRDSTQSRGLRWQGEAPSSSRDDYWEEFVPGIEYSVVLLRHPRGTTVFPPVWKGAVRPDLLPPWRRLRTVPSGLDADAAEKLSAITVLIADLLDASGFLEVEFILPESGPPLVIDVNPRVCGTMRIVAMATGSALFDWSSYVPGSLRLTATRFAAEVPHDGPPFVSDAAIASSRLTCQGSSADDVRELLVAHGHDVTDGSAGWPAGWQ